MHTFFKKSENINITPKEKELVNILNHQLTNELKMAKDTLRSQNFEGSVRSKVT